VFLRDVFYPAAKEIVDWHRRGTWFGIRVDPQDHLLAAGEPGTQLTWMDAKVGDWVVTPRHGKPVEINALWHGALALMAAWAHELGDPAAASYRVVAAQVRGSFRAKFWNQERQCLYDVLAEDGPVARLRPNQIFAVSLGGDLLEPGAQQAVVRIVQRELLTPVGLRTLERSDPEYRGRYEGGPWERDGAYHQGTVWPWLLGPFIDAYLLAFGQTEETLAYCRGLVERLEERARSEGCVGSTAEIYDGDEPRRPRGCPAQAWSVAEIARVRAVYNGFTPRAAASMDRRTARAVPESK
jgi:predicted glycogen debranching enzyme